MSNLIKMSKDIIGAVELTNQITYQTKKKIAKHSTNADAHIHVHTLTPMNAHPIPMSTSERLSRRVEF